MSSNSISDSDSNNGQSGYSSKASENKEDAWYNMPSNSKDKDNDSVAPSFTLPIYPIVTSTAFIVIPKTPYKEHSTGARIKAIYILEERRLAKKIKEVTGVSRTHAYALTAVARERG